MALYERSFEEHTAAPPLPLYAEEGNSTPVHVKDACYHLLKLYSNR